MITLTTDPVHLYISPEHCFFGHHGRAPGHAPMVEVDTARCVAGRGIEGDRFFDAKPNGKGQITFFAEETYWELCEQLGPRQDSPAVFRRNVITRGVLLNSLIGVEFVLQGIHFIGVEEAKPCYWMNTAFGPGAEAALRDRGGLRARVLSTGVLRTAARSEKSTQAARPPTTATLPS